MSSAAAYLLQQLRQQFDSSFEQAPEPPNEYEDLLFIRVGEQPFAVPVAEIKGLAKLERLTPIPSSASGFVGLSSARGDILAVFELSTLMGMNAGSQKLNWLLIAAGHDCALALGFSEIEGYSRIPKAQLPGFSRGNDPADRRVPRPGRGTHCYGNAGQEDL